jgi:glycosyltransferase involved in cell wall biosynthesis
MILIQPYYFWKGHYKKYCDSLSKNCIKIRAGKEVKVYFKNYNKNFIYYSLSRILNNIACILFLLRTIIKKKDISTVHFLEFEPLSFLFFLFINLYFRKKVIITIHATKINSSRIPYIIKLLQRFIFYFDILILNIFESKLIVHKKIDKVNLRSFFYKKIIILDYPSDKLNSQNIKKYKKNFKLLIFGQIRKDKGIEKFFMNNIIDNKFKITLAGEVENIDFWKNLKKKRNIKIYNKFISSNFLKKLILNHDFNFLPYSKNYTGSAGPLKLSMSFGQPVICSNIPIFKEFIKKNNAGFLYSKNIFKQLHNLKINEYRKISHNCVKYCLNNNFDNFYAKHKNIYLKNFSK